MHRRYHVLLNARAGGALSRQVTGALLQGAFAEAGLEATVDGDIEAPMALRIEKAKASPAEVLVAAGGDGTVTALASAAIASGKTLAILPMGTVNLLARDLAIPIDPGEALSALRDMQPRRIDIGEVNGIPFLHKVVIGLIPGIAAGRELIRGERGLQAKLKFIRFFFRRLARARRLGLAIEPALGDGRVQRVRAVAVANNAYDEGPGRFFARRRLDAGTLTLYVLKRLTVFDMLRLAIKMILGRWRNDEALMVESAPAVTIRSRKAKLKVMLDGEIVGLSPTLDFRLRPRALSVLAPGVPEASPEAEAETAALAVQET